MPCGFTLQLDPPAPAPKKGQQVTIKMVPPLSFPCTLEIRLDGVLINGSTPAGSVGDFQNINTAADGSVTVTFAKNGPSGKFTYKLTCPRRGDDPACEGEQFIEFKSLRAGRLIDSKNRGIGYIAIIALSIITGAVIGGLAFGPLGAVGGGGLGGAVGVVIVFLLDLLD
jgi:hypothetical protein